MVRVLTLALLVLAPVLRAGVHVVDPQGGPGAALLQATIDAAQPGDILLLHAGDYSTSTPARIQTPLTVVADTGQTVVLPALLADNMGLESRVVVRGLHIEAPAGSPWTFLFRFTIFGAVWVEDCTSHGLDAWPDVAALQSGFPATLAGQPGLILSVPFDAVVTRCSLEGGRGLDASIGPGGDLFAGTAGGAGLRASVGYLAVHDTHAVGGRGGDGDWEIAYPASGGAGLDATFGTQSIQGGSFTGGDEGLANPAATMPGSGLLCLSCTVSTRDAAFVAGAVQGDGTPVAAIHAAASDVTEFPAAGRFLAVDSPVREFGTAHAHLQGEPGDLAWIVVSTDFGVLPLASKQGAWLPSTAVEPLPLPVGPITDPSGQLELAFTLPALPVGEDGLVFFTQLVTSTAGSVLFGTGSAVVWVSAAY